MCGAEITRFSTKAFELLPKATSVARLVNSVRPREDGYPGRRVGSARNCWFIFPTIHNSKVCPSSLKYSVEENHMFSSRNLPRGIVQNHRERNILRKSSCAGLFVKIRHLSCHQNKQQQSHKRLSCKNNIHMLVCSRRYSLCRYFTIFYFISTLICFNFFVQ